MVDAIYDYLAKQSPEDVIYEEADIDPFDDGHFQKHRSVAFQKFNPYHDRLGRFTTPGGAAWRPEGVGQGGGGARRNVAHVTEALLSQAQTHRKVLDLVQDESVFARLAFPDGSDRLSMQWVTDHHDIGVTRVSDGFRQQTEDAINEAMSSPTFAAAVRKFGEFKVVPAETLNIGKLDILDSHVMNPTASSPGIGLIYLSQSAPPPVVGGPPRPGFMVSSAFDGYAGAIRHEYGHLVADYATLAGTYPKWEAACDVLGYNQLGARLTTYSGPRSFSNLRGGSERRHLDAWSEAFAIRTHPKFDKKMFDPEIQALFDVQEQIIKETAP